MISIDHFYFFHFDIQNQIDLHRESRGQAVTRWPGSQEVGGSIPGCATKFVRCKTWPSTLESVARIPRKAPMCIGRVIPEHVKDPRAPVDKSRVLIPCVTGQIPELLRIVKRRSVQSFIRFCRLLTRHRPNLVYKHV